MRRTLCRLSTLVKIGRGAENVTEAASNALLESLQMHGYCYVQHPFIQKEILDQLHRDSRIFFERYIIGTAAVANSAIMTAGFKHDTRQQPVMPLTPYELESIKTSTGFRGYYRYVGASGLDDAIECFSIGREVEDPAQLREAYYKLSGWSEEEYKPLISRQTPWQVLLNRRHVDTGIPNTDTFMADYREMMLAYYDLCAEVSLDVLRHISCGLGVRPSIPQGGPDPQSGYDLEFFTPFHSKLDFDLQAKYYPQLGQVARTTNGVEIKNARSVLNPRGTKVLRRKDALAQPLLKEDADEANKEVTIRLDTHKDLSTITLLAQDALGGMEVWDDEEEKYVAVPVLNDALLVNAGMFLEKWTGGLLEATPHRVRNVKEGRSRCSVVFFCLPNHDTTVEPLLQQDENPSLDAQEGFYAGDLMPASQ
ncbi:hypothetical protein TRSC58_05445 [Trypanosoma rangeli SC58]|uniref:Fe2OG dioxygenase domain-containing protein n=1 Tax=Trypanosoma rangeli SC58 TaxID=429131 RepID=A0A061IW18_TRYRA|nr:hypothetical protein TRSC58_05445 [Trypanosoma rangeli SC58]